MKKKSFISSAIFCGVLFIHSHLLASPSGGEVVAGNASISMSGDNLIVNQNSHKAVIQWDSFSIGEKEEARFILPSAQAAILNRVIGKDPSLIFGKLQSNGKVYLINQKGILIGEKGEINVASFVSSTLNVSNEDFMNKQHISFAGASRKKIVNEGKITAFNKDVYIFARDVVNEGTINAPNGKVSLCGGTMVYLMEMDADHIAVEVDGKGSISQQGVIAAAQVELQAAGGNIYSLAINQSGIVLGQGIAEKEGRVIIKAQEGNVEISGKVAAKGYQDRRGGTVHIFGEEVSLEDNAVIDVSSKEGLGTILVGGSYQGLDNAILHANKTYVSKKSVLNAEAKEKGSGGNIIIWGTDENEYHGMSISKGGAQGGNGGLIEVSSRNNLIYKGDADTSAPKGNTGILLLDPFNITISKDATNNGGFDENDIINAFWGFSSDPVLNVDELTKALLRNNVRITTNGGSQSGNIVIDDAITWSNNNSITFESCSSIVVNAPVTCEGNGDITFHVGQQKNGYFELNALVKTNGNIKSYGYANDDKFVINVPSNINIFGGMGKNNTVCGPHNERSKWTITGNNAGTLDIGGDEVSFSGIQNLIGGRKADTFIFTVLGRMTGMVDGGELGEENTVVGPTEKTIWTITAYNEGNINPYSAKSTKFCNIHNLKGRGKGDVVNFIKKGALSGIVDGGRGKNTIIGPDIDTIWSINAIDQGVMRPKDRCETKFSNFQNIYGGDCNDIFSFYDDFKITGMLNGGSGKNILDYSHYTSSIQVDLADQIASNLQGGIENIQGVRVNPNIQVNIRGNSSNNIFDFSDGFSDGSIIDGYMGNNTIIGPISSSNWNLYRENGGDITYDGKTLSFVNIHNVTGGEKDDRFVIFDGANITGLINGNKGSNIIDFSTLSEEAFVNLESLSATKVNQFEQIQIFIGKKDVGSTAIGSNHGQKWVIVDHNKSVSSDYTFIDFNNLNGGGGDDIFIFNDGKTLSGTLNGGGGKNTLDLSAYTIITEVNFSENTTSATKNIKNIQEVYGSKSNFPENIFVCPNFSEQWTLTQDYSVTNKDINFYHCGHLKGGKGNITFNIDGDFLMSSIEGNSNTDNILVSPKCSSIWNISLNRKGKLSFEDKAISFSNIQQIQGKENDSIISNEGMVWHIISDNSGYIDKTGIVFHDINNLFGSSCGDDVFIFEGDYSCSLIDGSSGNNTIIGPKDELVSWNIFASKEGAVHPGKKATNFKNIQTIRGRGNDVLTSHIENNTWNILADSGGNINDTDCLFSRIDYLVGNGSTDDVFIIGNNGNISSINGGGGNNKIVGSNEKTKWQILDVNSGSLVTSKADIDFSNIQVIQGKENDVLYGPENGAIWHILGKDEGKFITENILFKGIKHLIGGEEADQFIFADAVVFKGIIDGSRGDNILDLSNYTSSVKVNLQEGITTATPNFSNFKIFYGSEKNKKLNTIIGKDKSNYWDITNDYIGVVGDVQFTNFGSLVGGTIGDIFAFSNDAIVSEIKGLDHKNNKIIGPEDFVIWEISSNHTGIVTLKRENINFKNISEIEGRGEDTLLAFLSENTWNITSDNEGVLVNENISFYNINRLIGSLDNNDTFIFLGPYKVDYISGNGGDNNQIIGPQGYNEWILTSLHEGKVLSDKKEINFSHIHSIIGGGSDCITGLLGSDWNITNNQCGYVKSNDITFKKVSHIVGSFDKNDQFFLDGEFAFIEIDGNGGDNNILYGPEGHILWEIDGPNAITMKLLNLQQSIDINHIHTINGFLTKDTLIGPIGDSHWYLDGNDKGYIDEVNISYNNIGNIVGNEGNSVFTFNPQAAISGDLISQGQVTLNYAHYDQLVTIDLKNETATSINGKCQSVHTFIGDEKYSNIFIGKDCDQTWTITNDNEGNIDQKNYFYNFKRLIGGSRDDSFVFTSLSSIDGFIKGNGGNNSLIGPDIETKWLVTYDNEGQIVFEDNKFTVFSSIQEIFGGRSKNIFSLEKEYHFTSINGSCDAENILMGPNTKALWQITDEQSGVLTISLGDIAFSNINTIIGRGEDILTHSISDEVSWHIDSNRSGNFDNKISFKGMGLLRGNNLSEDHFYFSSNDSMLRIDGNSVGNNTIYSSNEASWLLTSKSHGIMEINEKRVSFENICHISGSGEDTLACKGDVTKWDITSDYSGIINDGENTFSGVKNLIGSGNGNDHFIFANKYRLSSIDANGGEDNQLTCNANDVTWIITGLQEGGLVLDRTIKVSFNHINKINGQLDDKICTYEKTLWNITNENEGDINGGIVFTNISNLVGKSLENIFVFQDESGLSGSIKGHLEGKVVLDYSNYSRDVFVDLSNTYSSTGVNSINHCTNVIGPENIDINVLKAKDNDNIWTITKEDSGYVNDVSFQHFQYLVGGKGIDRFVFKNEGSFNGLINGGDNKNNILDYSFSLAEAEINLKNFSATNISNNRCRCFKNCNTIILGDGDTSIYTGKDDATIYLGNGCNSIIGGGGGYTRVVGHKDFKLWEISDVNEGYVGNTSFSNVQQLKSSSDEDIFLFLPKGEIASIEGNGSTTIIGPDENTIWYITGKDAGLIARAGLEEVDEENGFIETGSIGEVVTTFSNVNTLVGGNKEDRFVFYDQQEITGSIDGGSYISILDFSNYLTPVFFDYAKGQALPIKQGAYHIVKYIDPKVKRQLLAKHYDYIYLLVNQAKQINIFSYSDVHIQMLPPLTFANMTKIMNLESLELVELEREIINGYVE